MTTYELQIEKLEEREQVIKAMFYGEAGTGKTVLASSAPAPILWLEAEGGTASIARERRADIDIARIDSLQQLRDALVFLQNNPGKYNTVVLDSLTEVQAIVLKEIMLQVVATDASRNRHRPFYDEWGMLAGIMRDVVRGFLDLPINVVFTALTREDKDEMTGHTRVQPRLQPSVAFEMPGFLDVMGYLYTATKSSGEVGKEGAGESEEGEQVIVRNLLIRPTGKYAAKIRIPAGSDAPDYIREPNWSKVQTLVLGEEK